ncbi:MAG: ribosomal-processing cysteine protease Prp [Clostridium sp.]|uniref:ribosomal-processing cysteine protease Prp n=1 Tax=Clostridium sp. TaxID=1506 RepID=UPI001D6762E8|nr:ribosomal-processing cysteine protease Prp [Clostridium sp.]MBS4803734.1 ribosomal-processing cysteine protease Prp [Clostridium sp.]MBS5939423.1 ribosomal-processing cysteine protease Prp [Clostridium sp.]MBS5948934.1 ribosomal-processing cysteine protease Prp [Clostridium sp.]
MIEIKIFKKENLRLGFKIEGHALSKAELEKSGDAYDLICNSVSVLSQGTLIGIEEVLKLKVKYKINDGFLHINLSNLKDQDLEKCQVLLLTFEKSIESLMQSLKLSFGSKTDSEYIRLLEEEVQ